MTTPHPWALPVLAAALTAPAAAATPTADVDRIQARLDAASRLFESDLPADALAVLDEVAAELGADGEAQFPLLRFMMARCLIELDRPEEALAALARFEALARDDEERALAAEWTAKVRARAYGALVVECPPGGVARIEAEGAPDPRPCPATFDAVRAGTHRVRVDGLDAPRTADAEVIAGESRTVTPVAPAPTPRWLWGGLALAGGTGLVGGAVPDGVEPGAGAHASAELFGEVAVIDGFRLRLGVGYAYAGLAFEDAALDTSGQWIRHGLVVPLDVRVALPWSLAVTVGGGLDVALAGEEIRDDRDTDLGDRLTPLGGFARVALERPVLEAAVDLRVALRFQRWLTPLIEESDPVMQTLDLGLYLVL